MKFLICGFGSIGQRHARNLKKILPECEIIAYRSTVNNKTPIEKELKIKTYTSLDQALEEKPIAAFITNPTSFHIKTAIKCAQKGTHLFIEKPLADSFNGLKQLENLISQKRLIVMVGFMMRYNPGLIKIKYLLEKNALGPVISAQFVNGEYLPSWHPGSDYKKAYSARKELGGGIILTFTHEIDLASWLFGKVYSLYCTTSKSHLLKTDVEDSADILMNCTKNVKVSLHLDHIAQPPLRTLSIIGDEGRLEWSYYQNTTKWYDTSTQKWKSYKYSFERNMMFIRELKEFLSCVKSGNKTTLGLAAGIGNLQIALKAKRSAKYNRLEKI